MKIGRFLSLLLILCLLSVPAAFAEESGPEALTSGEYSYVLDGDGAVITGYSGGEEALAIPDTLDGHPVRAIDGYAFTKKESLISVVIPEGVERLGECAFYNNKNLTTVTLPDSLTDIASDAFATTALREIIISQGHGTYSVYEGVLYNKKEKTLHTYPCGRPDKAFKVPKGIVNIGNDAFYDNTTLTSIQIADTVVDIGNLAFAGMSNLTSLYIPDSVSTIGTDAFEGSGIERFEVSDTNDWLKATDGILYNPKAKTLEWYPPAKEGSKFAIPPGILHIGGCAFNTTLNLESLQIPDTVVDIGNYAFYRSSLTSLTIPNSVTEIGQYAFAKSDIKEIKLPQGLTQIPEGMMYMCDLKSLTIPETVTAIGDMAFYKVWEMTSVIIPSSVTAIGSEAFFDCRDLTDITLPQSIAEIGEDAFFDCPNLTLWVVDGSYAQEYAKENGLSFSIKPDWL